MEILSFGYIVGCIVGVIGGIGLIIFNLLGNKSETDNGRLFGLLGGVILITSCLQRFIGREAAPFLMEILYLVAGVYLVREHYVSFESLRVRIIFAVAGYLILLVPLRMIVSILLLWRAVV